LNKIHIKVKYYNIINMEQILNPFDKIDPLSNYEKMKAIIINIKDKQLLLEISKMLENRLKQFN